MYNYFESVKEDAKEYILDNYTKEEIKENLENRRSWEGELYDEMFDCDSVTGNGSGSYTFNTFEAEENLAHNWDLIRATAEDYGLEPVISDEWLHGPEWWDVSIRCYLLPSAINEALDEIENEIEEEDKE